MKTKEEIEKEIQAIRGHLMMLKHRHWFIGKNTLAGEIKEHEQIIRALEWVLGKNRENNKNNAINVAFTEYTNSRDLGWYYEAPIMREEAYQTQRGPNRKK